MKTILKSFILLFLLFLPYKWLIAQPFAENYEHITTRDGLPHNIVQTVLQDSKGFLWVGTYQGLCIHNGNTFNVYKEVFGKSENSWQNIVDVIYEDKSGNVWLGSRGGAISCYVRATNHFLSICTSSSNLFKQIRCIFQDSTSRIWVSDVHGNIAVLEGNRFLLKSKLQRPVFFMHALDKDNILMACEAGVFNYDIANNVLMPYIKDMAKHTVISCAVSNRYLAVVTGSIAFIADIPQKIIIDTIDFHSSERSRAYHKVIAANSSGFHYTDGSVITNYSNTGVMINSFAISDHSFNNKGDIINHITADKEGLLWVGTNTGLLKINPKKYAFNKFSQNNLKRKLTHNYVRTIHVGNSIDMWIGMKGGMINKLQFDRKSAEYHFHSSYPLKVNDGRLVKEYTTNCFVTLKDGNLLAGGENGVYLLNKQKKVFEPYCPQILADSISMVWCLMEDGDNLWIGTHSAGLFVYDRKRNTLFNYSLAVNISGQESSNSVWNLHKDHRNNIWIGTNDGLYEVINRIPSDIRYRRNNLTAKQVLHVWDIKEDNDKNLWVATTNYGVFKITANRQSVYHHNVLPNNMVSSVVPVSKEEIWVSTVFGLYRYNPLNRSFTTYRENDGTISDDYNFKCATIAGNGELFFGSKSGMISFLPKAISPHDNKSMPIAITALTVAGTDYFNTYCKQKSIRLNWNGNFFNASFSVLDFISTRNYLYRYKLVGFDKKWNYLPEGQSSVSYTNLPPGKYTLSIQSSNDKFKSSISNAELSVLVVPTIWQVPFFRAAIVLLLLIIVILAVYLRIKRIIRKEKNKNEINKKIAELELNALQSQMNPHFIFNTINSIQHYILHNNEIAANDYLSKFARLMRLFLESSKNKYVQLHDEIEMLKLYLSLEKLRFEDKFDYIIEEPASTDINTVLIPSMLLQPFVENSIKHGFTNSNIKGVLKITFSVISANDNVLTLVCSIDDNGIGRQQAAVIKASHKTQHISRGMELINDRVKTYNYINDQHITITTVDKTLPYTGTTVIIKIPIDPKIN